MVSTYFKEILFKGASQPETIQILMPSPSSQKIAGKPVYHEPIISQQ